MIKWFSDLAWEESLHFYNTDKTIIKKTRVAYDIDRNGHAGSGNFMVGRKTEKSRLRRSMIKLTSEIRRNRHEPIKDQLQRVNQILRGHYNYYMLSLLFLRITDLVRVAFDRT